MDIYAANSQAWDEEVRRHNYWTLPASETQISEAREKRPGLWITPFRNVPQSWLEGLDGQSILVACGGGGQQTPLLAAYGCKVTAIDISRGQLDQDKVALERYGLHADLVCANVLDMPFGDQAFSAVIMPEALNFIDDIQRLYSQMHRVLKPGGYFMYGVANPALYMFDDRIQQRKLKIKYTIPFSDTGSLSARELQRRLAKKDTVEFSHTLETIIGGLLSAGFVMEGFYTDECGSELTDSFLCDCHMAIRARKV